MNNTIRQDLFILRDLIPLSTGEVNEEISGQSNIPKSVLNEIEKGNTLLSDSTIYRFYKLFFKLVDSSLLGIRHEWIRLKFLKEKLERDGELDNSLEHALESSSILRKLYLESRLHSIDISNVKEKYGDEGKIGLEVLENYGLLKINSEGLSYSATDRSLSKRPTLLKKLMNDCVSMGINEKNLWGIGQNTCFYGMEWVSEESFEKIISIMDKAKK